MARSTPLAHGDGVKVPLQPARGDDVRHSSIDPGDTFTLDAGDKLESRRGLAESVEILAKLQNRLYAQDCWSVLRIFKAVDATGKDGTVKHLMSGVNPQGCRLTSLMLHISAPQLAAVRCGRERSTQIQLLGIW
jgi:hypothetical protein